MVDLAQTMAPAVLVTMGIGGALLAPQTAYAAYSIPAKDDLILNPARQQLTRAGQTIELPPIQFKLLKLLMRHSPKVLTKQEIMMELWGDEEPESDALRSHIYNLRKMVDKPFDQKLIHTISGVGLKIALEP